MYKSTDYEHEQLSFINFNMAFGMQLDMNNEWIRIAQQLPWKAWEALYVAIFPSNTGNVAKPCRMVLGSLILQMRLGFTDRELVDQLRQNPYYKIRLFNENRIRISGPKLGRPFKDEKTLRKNRKTAAKKNTDRIEIEQYFSTAKRRNGMGRITRKREDTSLSTIAMSV